jgi:uncharacterized protein
MCWRIAGMDRRHFLAVALVVPQTAWANKFYPFRNLIEAARLQIGVTTRYDPAYVKLRYPGGDVPIEGGVCTDVVVRAYRKGLGIDLQKLVHEDMLVNFSAYPTAWGLKKPDRNIDHRRVPNLQTFFKRKGAVSDDPLYQPGDLVSMMLPGNLPHIGIVSNTRSEDGSRPLFIHNIGGGTQEEDVLQRFAVTGRYRFGLG